MANKAILIANVEYLNLSRLDCCRDDVLAIKELLEATEKYSEIEIIENAEANDLKTRIRDAIDKSAATNELFFYYTGHGFQHETEFFFCATNFDAKRPNETGLSSTELHTLLKLADADLVVKVIDACNSGTLLVKADGGIMPPSKQGFKNLIQISSCLDSQNSLAGHPLSLFTANFRAAALRKTEGIVYYTDIISTLRDEFLENNSQTPFFVSQVTGREQFVEDGARLNGLRVALQKLSMANDHPSQPEQQIVPAATTLADMLAAAEAKVAKPELVATFVSTFFDNLIKRLSTAEFADFFDVEFVEHADFTEPTAKEFIIRVLSNEKRSDNFVTATITRKRRKRNPWNLGLSSALMSLYGDDDDFTEYQDLDLNCSMARTQLKMTLTPRFSTLHRLILVVTCAPSLEHCYAFEVATQHLLRDFGKFDIEGTEVTRRWYKFLWNESTDGVVTKISQKLGEVVRAHLQSTTVRLRKEQ
jgi:hypothetical protein